MPSGFFCLLRFYLRVDSTLVRVNDVRIYHPAGSGHLVREITEREASAKELEDAGVSENFAFFNSGLLLSISVPQNGNFFSSPDLSSGG